MATYTANNINSLSETTPDGATEGPSSADDAIREIKRAIRRMGILRTTTYSSAAPTGLVTDGLVKLNTTSNDVDYQLPAASTVQLAVVKWDSGSNTAKISPAGSDTIDGSASEITFSTLGEVWVLHSDGTTKWSKISRWYEGSDVIDDEIMNIQATKTGSGAYYREIIDEDLDDYGGSVMDHYFLNQFNTVNYNNIDGASITTTNISDDTIVLPTGRYHITGWGLCNAQYHRLMLVSSTSVIAVGGYYNGQSTFETTTAVIDTIIDVVSGPTNYNLIHTYRNGDSSKIGGDVQYLTWSALTNVFCDIVIKKVAET